MASFDKLIDRFKEKPNDFTWKEAVRLLKHFGYEVVSGGSGSHRKFFCKELDHMLLVVEPHPKKILKMWQVRKLLEELRGKNLL